MCISCRLVGVISQLMFTPCSLAPWVSCQDFFVQSDEETDCNSGWGSERRVAVDVSEWKTFSTRVNCNTSSSKHFFLVKLSTKTTLSTRFFAARSFFGSHIRKQKGRFTKIWFQHLDRWEAYVGIKLQMQKVSFS